MTTVRFYLAVLLVVSVPPVVAFWCVAHTLAPLWRRVGTWVAYTVLVGLMFVVGWGCFLVRDVLMGRDLGNHALLAISGLLLYGFSVLPELRIRKHLTLKTLVGFPELAPDRTESELLTEGIYGRVRHPRYAATLVGMTGFALVTNYSGVYLVVALALPGIYLITVLEERELLVRFGEAYRRYQEEVPRFVPRLWRGE
jgi:protein-S-isoprenylcysteine O-methyltransferase Ste14